MAVVSILPYAELGRTYHRECASHFMYDSEYMLTWILATLDLSAFASLKTVYSINSSKFDILTADGTETVTLDEAVKDAKPNVEAIHNFTRANVPYGYISTYR